MSRDPAQRIADVLEAIERCRRYVAALDGDSGLLEMAEDAIERNLQIIGEAVNHLPAEITGAHPEIAWPQVRGFRNILVHEYFGVEVDIVRDVGPISRLSPKHCCRANRVERYHNRVPLVRVKGHRHVHQC